MYFYEIHMHTAESSRCGNSSAADMVRTYAEKGFSGVVVTDHFINGNSWCRDVNGGWAEKMDAFLKGYYTAKEAGEKYGIKVYPGWEYTYKGSGEDYLTLGLSEKTLYTDFVDCDTWTIEEYIRKIHELGGIIVRAHPFREAGYMRISCIDRPGLPVDAVEVYNAGNGKESYNERAVRMAIREGKPMTAGSDTHHINTTAQCYLGFDEDPADYQALCDAIKGGKAHLIRNGEVRDVNRE